MIDGYRRRIGVYEIPRYYDQAPLDEAPDLGRQFVRQAQVVALLIVGLRPQVRLMVCKTTRNQETLGMQVGQ